MEQLSSSRNPDFKLIHNSIRQLDQLVMEITDVSVKFSGTKVILRFPKKENGRNEDGPILMENADQVDEFISAQIKTSQNIVNVFKKSWLEALEELRFNQKTFLNDLENTKQQITQKKSEVLLRIQQFDNQRNAVLDSEKRAVFFELNRKFRNGIYMSMSVANSAIENFLELIENQNNSAPEKMRVYIKNWSQSSSDLFTELTEFTFYVHSVEIDEPTAHKLKELLARADNVKTVHWFHDLEVAAAEGIFANIEKFRTMVKEHQTHLNEVMKDFYNFLASKTRYS